MPAGRWEFAVVLRSCKYFYQGSLNQSVPKAWAKLLDHYNSKIKSAVADAGYDKEKLTCAQCKLKESIKNRKNEQKLHDRNSQSTKKHNDRIKLEVKELKKVENRLKELE